MSAAFFDVLHFHLHGLPLSALSARNSFRNLKNHVIKAGDETVKNVERIARDAGTISGSHRIYSFRLSSAVRGILPSDP